MNRLLLRQQFKRQGLAKKDVKSLSNIAHGLGNAYPSLSSESKKRIAAEIGFKPQGFFTLYRVAAGSAFAAFAVLIVLAQSALPGSVLYALKRGTEEVRVVLQPGFGDDQLKQRRDEEQKKLKEHEAEVEAKSGKTQSSSGTSGSSSKTTSDDNKTDDNPKSTSKSSSTSTDSQKHSSTDDSSSTTPTSPTTPTGTDDGTSNSNSNGGHGANSNGGGSKIDDPIKTKP